MAVGSGFAFALSEAIALRTHYPGSYYPGSTVSKSDFHKGTQFQPKNSQMDATLEASPKFRRRKLKIFFIILKRTVSPQNSF